VAPPQVVKPVVPVVVPPVPLAPNTLPPGTNLVVKCCRPGQLVKVVLNPANRLYILRGTRIEFQADHAGGYVGPLVNFAPSVWGGTAGVVGAAATQVHQFDTLSAANSDLGAFTVTVTFGGQTVVIRCVVYALTTSLVPGDAFAGRSLSEFGVDERVTLGFAAQPAGVTAADAGGLQWSVASPGRDLDGLLHNPATHAAPAVNDGRAEYIAPCRTHAQDNLAGEKLRHVVLKLRVASGPCQGTGPDVPITVHMPSAHMRKAAAPERHILGTPSAGFFGEIFFSPKNVSFETLSFREGAGAIRTYGFGNDHEDGVVQHPVGGVPIRLTGGHQHNGCGLTGGALDDVYSGAVAGFHAGPSDITVVGKETWPIHWEYTYNDLATGFPVAPAVWIRMQIAYHTATLYASGRMEMFKGHVACAEGLCNARVSKALGDPSVP
jgi:hypothetical protein